MVYTNATKPSRRTPCTNVPIHCLLCPPISPGQPATVWKYNALNHILTCHADSEGNVPDVPAQMLLDMHISKLENKWMKVDLKVVEDWREQWGVPDSDGIEVTQAELESNAKRDRSESTTAAGEKERRQKSARTR